MRFYITDTNSVEEISYTLTELILKECFEAGEIVWSEEHDAYMLDSATYEEMLLIIDAAKKTEAILGLIHRTHGTEKTVSFIDSLLQEDSVNAVSFGDSVKQSFQRII